MDRQDLSSSDFPFRISSPSGLSIQVNANGSVRRMDFDDILLNLFPGTEIEGGPANLYLRRHGRSIESIPLTGPCSPAGVHIDPRGSIASGEWQGIRFHVSLLLAKSFPAWFWHVILKNIGNTPQTLDLLYAQDLALAHYGAVRMNEYYVCHYLDHTPLSHPLRGTVVASRQNLSMGGRNPWTMIGALGRGIRYSTDALQFHGLATRAGLKPQGLSAGLPDVRLQHEHAMIAIQEDPVRLDPGRTFEGGFFGGVQADHPGATSAADLAFVERVLALPEAAPPQERFEVHPAAAATLFSAAPLLDTLDLTETEVAQFYGGKLRQEERLYGRLLSFFAGSSHVVLKAKELKVLRPHAHILRTGDLLIPEETSLTTTTWMAGVFHSMVTQGHVSINRFLSTVHSYLSLLRANGQRIFVEMADGWRLLDVPSAFEMEAGTCRWIYKHRLGMIAVRSTAHDKNHELTLSVEVLSGPPTRFLLSNHVAVNGDDGSEAVPVRYSRDENGWFIHPKPDSDVGRRFPEGGFSIAPLPGTLIEREGGDELLFVDGRSRNQPFLCMVTAPTGFAGFRLTSNLIPVAPADAMGPGEALMHQDFASRLLIHPPGGAATAASASRIGEILPWFVQNAMIHYLAPRGIEQYTGGGWGTRDICQGAVEMLLAFARFEPVRDLLLRVFRNQNPDGDWPQWFMFFDRERNIRPGDSHGDIVFWPLLALSQYLIASEDAALLDEEVPFFHPQGEQHGERATLLHHVERALSVIRRRVIPGTPLPAYGNGDWNDSLQPIQPAMREQLCSTWTVTLHYQTLVTLAAALRLLGRGGRADALEAMAAEIRHEFKRLLIVDEILAGFAYFRSDGAIDYLLHPRDRETGLSYSLLPMIHAVINDLLNPQEAEKHLGLVRTHLLAPDGARLFDRPMEYRGGPQRYFQRAESAAFFGREIGLMYTHAHLRYAEALAHYGDAEGFFQALCKANPIGIRELVPSAALRQSNCYYSSSDAAFADRHQAYAEYDRVKKGEVPFDGGWRVYSSGAGIFTRLALQCFLGMRFRKSLLVLDPMIPRSLDGLRVEMEFERAVFEIVYSVRSACFGPTKVNLNGADLPFTRGSNPYRSGSAEIPMGAVRERLHEGVNRLAVYLG